MRCERDGWWLRETAAQASSGPCKWRSFDLSGGHTLEHLMPTAQAPYIILEQTASAAHAETAAATFEALCKGVPLPYDLLSSQQLMLHDLIHVKEHSDRVALQRLALFASREQLRSVILNLSFSYEPSIRQWDKHDRLRAWQEKHVKDQPFVQQRQRNPPDSAPLPAPRRLGNKSKEFPANGNEGSSSSTATAAAAGRQQQQQGSGSKQRDANVNLRRHQ